MSQTVIFDLSNLAYIGAFRCRNEWPQSADPAETVYQATLTLMRQLYRMFRPEQVWFACDHHTYWRTQVFPQYKANREDRPQRDIVRAAIRLVKAQHAALCIEQDECEADDVICGLVKNLPGQKVIVSSDGDFVQLITPEVRLFNPLQMEFRLAPHKPEFELFLKCIRGDRGDNIPAAYPRVTKRALQAAFGNPGAFQKLMATKLAAGTVGEAYALNRMLIDFNCIPEAVLRRLVERIQNACGAVERTEI